VSEGVWVTVAHRKEAQGLLGRNQGHAKPLSDVGMALEAGPFLLVFGIGKQDAVLGR
jgi:hypothetical protein